MLTPVNMLTLLASLKVALAQENSETAVGQKYVPNMGTLVNGQCTQNGNPKWEAWIKPGPMVSFRPAKRGLPLEPRVPRPSRVPEARRPRQKRMAAAKPRDVRRPLPEDWRKCGRLPSGFPLGVPWMHPRPPPAPQEKKGRKQETSKNGSQLMFAWVQGCDSQDSPAQRQDGCPPRSARLLPARHIFHTFLCATLSCFRSSGIVLSRI